MIRKAALILSILMVWGSTVSARQLSAYAGSGIYYAAGTGPYVELYLKIPMQGLHAKKEGNGLRTGVLVQWRILKADTAVFNSRYSLNSPLLKDSSQLNNSLMDLQRLGLPNGSYRLQLSLQDAFDSTNRSFVNSPLEINMTAGKAAFSSIMVLDTFYTVTATDAFSRNDFDYIPSVSNLFAAGKGRLLFYTELYNAAEAGRKMEIRYSLKDGLGQAVNGFGKSRYRIAQPVIVLLDNLDIAGLKAGKYTLFIELLDENKFVQAKKEVAFTIWDKDVSTGNFALEMGNRQIAAFVSQMSPVMPKEEIGEYDKALHSHDTLALKNWFFAFWEKQNPANPARAFQQYAEKLAFVKEHFSTPISRSGLSTDRGRIYLQYGPPDYVAPYIDEPNAYPYEIWQYYTLGTQSNVKIVFYNPTGIENEYSLVHSDLKNEPGSQNWKTLIYRKINNDTNFERNSTPGNMGTHLDDRLKE